MPTDDQLRLHVAMVSETFYPFVGGVAAQILSTAQELQKRRLRVSVITKQMPGCPLQEEIRGIQVHRIQCSRLRSLGSVGFLMGAMRRLWQIRPSLVHAHELLLPTSAALLANQRLQLPLVVTVHASGPDIGEVARLQRTKLGTLRMEMVRRQVDRFIAISRITDTDLSMAGIPAEKRIAIPNGVDMNRFCPVNDLQKRAIRRTLNITDVPTVIYTGRLSSEKRVMHLLDIWQTVRRTHPTAQLLVVGDGPQMGLLHSRASDGIHFVGDQEDVAPWLQAADVFVMPSVSEGFSLSTLEALAVGLPCIATSVGAIPEFISHGTSGLIVRPDDTVSLQNGLINLLSDSTLRKKLSTAARAGVENRYSIQQVAQQLEETYRQLCDKQESA